MLFERNSEKLNFIKMSESHHNLACASVNLNYDECHVEHRSKETEGNEEQKHFMPDKQNRSFKNNDSDSNTNTFSSNDKEFLQKDDHLKNSNVCTNLLRIMDNNEGDEDMLISTSKRDEDSQMTNSKHNINSKIDFKEVFDSDYNGISNMDNDKGIQEKISKEETVINTTHRRLRTIVDSESEEEKEDEGKLNSMENDEHKGENGKHYKSNTKKIQRRLQTLVDSESEEENADEDKLYSVENDEHKEDKEEHYKSNTKKIQRRLQTLVDSESEEENADEDKLYSVENDEHKEEKGKHYKSNSKKTQKRFKTIVDSESEEEKEDEDKLNSVENDEDKEEKEEHYMSDTKKIQKRLQTLVDSESEEDEDQSNFMETDEHKEEKGKHHKSNMKKESLIATKEKAMKTIQSETQRLVRESRIRLPYHIPKQRTLQEFLSRKKVLTSLPKAPTMAAKLKLSSVIVDKVLKEKEKEAEIFYKSSDSEEEISEHHSDKENTNVESVQNHTSNVSRKLFANNSFSTDDNEKTSCTSTVQKTNETSTNTNKFESNESLIDDTIEENVYDSTILKTQCEADNRENGNKEDKLKVTEEFEISKNKDDLLEKPDVHVNLREGKVCSDDNRNTSKSINESSNPCTSKINDDYANIVKQSLGIGADESDEYSEYGLPPPTFDDSPNIDKQKRLQSIQNFKPKLIGTPGTVIDLSDDIKPHKEGINSLMSKQSETNGNSNITIPHVKKSANLVHEDPKLKKPGSKLMRLKEELKNRMALKRDEEWKQKDQEFKQEEIEWNESMNEEDNFCEPFSPSIESYQSTDDELEEDDSYIKPEKRNKCTFIDDEAEISEVETSDSDEIIDEDEIQESLKDKKECEEFVSEDETENSTCDDADVPSKHKTFKRIMEPLEDDSRSCDIEDVENKTNTGRNTFSQVAHSIHMSDASTKENMFSDNESDIPMSQVPVENDIMHQMNDTPQAKRNSFNLVSPVMQLTALNTCLNSGKKSDKVERNLFTDESSSLPTQSTQTKDSSEFCNQRKQKMSQKKLFTDQGNVLDEELIQICSGKFIQGTNNMTLQKEPSVTESQLLEVCSGTFNTQTDNTTESLNDVSDEKSQDLQMYLKRDSISTKKNIDEKKKESKDIMPWKKLNVMSSDEEDLIEKDTKKQSKKKVKKLDLSDEEDEEENDPLVVSDDEDDEHDEKEYIDYDSEENEVVVGKKDIKLYASNFVDAEAELSESDCDVSADEDEQDLDNLELEEGDDEEVDETQLRSQLGKFHMKQILDEDQREVRMIKELLFEEGDLYSESGRERKFKWRNIDKQEDNDNSQPMENKDGWVDLSDDEDEAKWCKIRHEREKFLAEKMENADNEIENDLNDSQVFKLGMKILKKRRIDEYEKQNTLMETLDSKVKSRIPHTIADMLNNSSSEGKSRTIHNILQKRSFLARGEESLARLATLAKQKDAPLSSVNSKKFIFTHVNPSTEVENTPIAGTEVKRFQPKKRR